MATTSPQEALWASIQSALADPMERLSRVPGAMVLWRYILASHQDDPFRTLLELALVVFIVRTYSQRRTRAEASGRNFVKLTEKEIEELVDEWNPEPLVAPVGVSDMELAPVILGESGPRARVLLPPTGALAAANPALPYDPHDLVNPLNLDHAQGKIVTNFASANFAGFQGREEIKEQCVNALKRYGVGSCGPAGFYGTFDVHLELERDLAAFLAVPSGIIYPHSYSTISSLIPCFSKRGDIIVADRGCNFAIQRGIEISRSTVRWYKHGDMDDLERVLEGIAKDDRRYGRKSSSSRRFIITEGLFENDGLITHLPSIIALKKEHKFRLILDESWSFGVVGASGRGVTELHGVPAPEVDILTGSMAIGLCAGGGFCVGSKEVIHHQRINSPAAVFSASLPPLLAVSSSAAITLLQGPLGTSHPLANLDANIKIFRAAIEGLPGLELVSDPRSPLQHLSLRSTAPGSTRTDIDALLQRIVEEAYDGGVLLARTRREWERDAWDRPSIRVCLTGALGRKEMEKAAQAVKHAVTKVLGKGSPGGSYMRR